MVRIAINGFGRIGRQAFKAGFGREDVQFVAINDLGAPEILAHLLKYDTQYGVWDVPIEAKKNLLKVDGKKIQVFSEKDPANLPWKKLNVDIVIESTGVFLTEDDCLPHLVAGAKRVIISAPAKGGHVPTYLVGVNTEKLENDFSRIINCASCTTNCVAPMLAVLDEAFGIKKAMMTTIHSYTSNQNLVDGPHKDPRRARAAAMNMIPTSTGASEATADIFPNLTDRFDGLSIRIPLPVVSLTDLTVVLKKRTTVEKVNTVFKKASRTHRWEGILGATEEPLVSSDYIGDAHSAVVDLPLTRLVDGDLLKVTAWYDNEWGYANRLIDLAVLASN
ncbi:MAG: type I glyceraldehyde-3-phosphate dehydrogenase [Patescibacteria group bacterium]|jgi:glyceraldehyde-3-phosphate dehydrogenase type I